MGGGAGLVGGCVLVGRHLLVEHVVAEALCGHLVEALYVDEAVDEALLVHLDHVCGDAAQGVAGLDAAVDHLLAYVLDGGQRGAARAGLDREAVVEVAAVDDYLGGLLGQEDVARVLGVADGAGGDLGAVADALHLHHVVHLALGDGVGHVGVGHEVVGEDHDLVGMLCVGQGVAQRAADALGVLGAGIAGGVAEGVGAGGAEEGDVDVQVAVAAEDNRLVHDAGADGLGQLAAHAGGGDAGDDAVADVLDQGRVHVLKARCGQVQVLEAHLGELVDDHVDHLVAAAEVVVEGDGHAVLKAGAADCSSALGVGFLSRLPSKTGFCMVLAAAAMSFARSFSVLITSGPPR